MATRIVTLKSALLAVMAGGLVSTATVSSAASIDTVPSLTPITVLASADTAKDGRKAHRGGRHEARRHADRGLMIPGVGPLSTKLLEELELTDAQKVQLNDAKEAQKTLSQERRDLMKKAFEERNAQLEQGKLDPRASISAMEAAHAAQADKRKEVQEKWLGLWDALEPAQQEKVVKHLNERKERHARHDRKRHENGGKRAPQVPSTEEAVS